MEQVPSDSKMKQKNQCHPIPPLSVSEYTYCFSYLFFSVIVNHIPSKILPQIPIRTLIESRLLKDKGGESARMTANES